MSYAMLTTAPEDSLPVEVRFTDAVYQRRWTVVVRFFLCLPQVVVLVFVGAASFFVAAVGWFAALVMGRLPDGIATFLCGVLRWTTRVNAYFFLITDQYPPFSLASEESYPVDVISRAGNLNRGAVLFRIVLVIPAAVVSALSWVGIVVLALPIWLWVVLVGHLPAPVFGAVAATLRYQTRVTGYYWMLTSTYPGQLFGDPQVRGEDAAPMSEPVLVLPHTAQGQPLEGAATPLPTPLPPREIPSIETSSWRLVLTPGARIALIVVLFLGVLGIGASEVATNSFRTSVSVDAQSFRAQNQVVADYNALAAAGATFRHSEAACKDLTCVGSAFAMLSDAIDAYVQELQEISYPANSVVAARDAEAAGTAAASTLRVFATSPKLFEQIDLDRALASIDSTFMRLNQSVQKN